jgi:hypothetical protein
MVFQAVQQGNHIRFLCSFVVLSLEQEFLILGFRVRIPKDFVLELSDGVCTVVDSIVNGH